MVGPLPAEMQHPHRAATSDRAQRPRVRLVAPRHRVATGQPRPPLCLAQEAAMAAGEPLTWQQLPNQPSAAEEQRTHHRTEDKRLASKPNRYPPESCRRTADTEEPEPA